MVRWVDESNVLVEAHFRGGEACDQNRLDAPDELQSTSRRRSSCDYKRLPPRLTHTSIIDTLSVPPHALVVEIILDRRQHQQTASRRRPNLTVFPAQDSSRAWRKDRSAACQSASVYP
jgi:hypothetical protein